MRIAPIFVILIVVICSVGSVQAGQQQAVGVTQGFSSTPGFPGEPPSFSEPATSASVLQRPPASYRPNAGSVQPSVEENDFPRYPYPPNPNPYYEGTTNRNALSEGFGWLWDASASLAGRVGNFVDNRLFPLKPATAGPKAPQVSTLEPPPPSSAPPTDSILTPEPNGGTGNPPPTPQTFPNDRVIQRDHREVH